MFTIPGYRIFREAYAGNNRLLFEGEREKDHVQVHIKACSPESSMVSTDHAAICGEYEILKHLDISVVPKAYSLEESPNGPILILEYIPGQPLSKYAGLLKNDLSALLDMMITITNSLAALHENHLIHMDIQPAHLFYDPITSRIQLIDFRYATFISPRNPHAFSPNGFKGTPAYMSPEQTGRMNRAPDYRTDLYSLGVVFYEFLTGKLPHTGQDTLEIIHSHLAKQAVPPCEIDKDIPDALSDIVSKLLSKKPEDRYQNAHGLLFDLKNCRQQLSDHGLIERFQLGGKDVSTEFSISRKIYGREKEIKRLLNGFEKACQGTVELIMISGDPGVGKTSLAREINIPVSIKNGYFISGKFELFQKNEPYSAIIRAFKGLIRQLLSESEDRLNRLKQDLLTALGSNGRIMIDVIPDVELIIGPQPALKKLDPLETQNRFNHTFMNFARVFCRQEHPLVIFLDDLQWVDTATLKMMEQIMTDGTIRYFLLVGAYRDTEVPLSHNLLKTFADLESANIQFSQIELKPLIPTDGLQLIIDTLHRDQQSVRPLAELIMNKTNGNPFFMNQFLTMLYQENLLVYNQAKGFWEWDLATIRKLDITDNVADLLVRRLEHLPRETKNALRIAACIGARFDLTELGIVTGQNRLDLTQNLMPALNEELIDAAEAPSNEGFKFRHNRLQRAFYELTNQADRPSLHLKIGRLMRENSDSDEQEEKLFEIVRHYNFGAGLIESQEERQLVASLNFESGKKAKAAVAFESAFEYFQTGIRLLKETGWESDYDLMLSLHLESTETARLHNNYKELDRLFQAALGKTKTILDQTDFYQSKILAAVARNQTIDALETADEFLLKMGFKILSQPDQLDLQVEVDKILERLANADIEELITNPQQSDPLRQAATKILQSAAGAAYLDHQDMFPIYAIRFLDLAFGFSNISDTAVACVVLGTILCGSVGDIEAGFRFGRLALDLLKRSDATELEAKIYFGFEFMIHHWKDHLRNSFDLLEKGYHSGVENGDFEFAGYNAFWHGFHLFLAGLPLEEVKNKLQLQADKIRQIKQVAPFGYNSIFQQTVLNLQAEKRTSQQLTGSIYDERAMLPIHQQYGDRLAIFFLNFCKMILSYLFEDYHEALKCADNAMENKDKAMGQAAIPVLIFFSSLNRLALFGKAVPRQQRGALAKIKESQLTMKKWADQAPMNNLHRYHLVEAELSRVLGQDEKALEHYNKSCELARENGYCHEEALANELTGKFWLKKEKLEFAGLFMQRALHCYALWGATSKINHLVERYSKLLVRMGIDTGSRMSSALNAPHGVRSFTNMDLQTMIKASQAISGEIILEKLLTTLMRIVIENAGAESGFFLLNSGDKLLIAAQGAAEDGVVKIRSLDPLEEGEQQMSTAIIQYVARTRKYVILNNAAEEGEFKTTPYIQAHLPKSILCIPIVYKSELTGLLYLENRLVPGIFSSSRLEMLELLVSQVAISIENARLFEEQKRAEEKYRGIFENAIEGIFQATPNGCFLSANSATALLFGFESPEELCRDITDIPTQLFTSKDTWDKFLVLITENNTVNEYEIQCFRKDGAKIWISLNAKSILADHKEIELIEGFIIDISERKYATEALLQREESLRKENLRLRSNIKDRYRFGQIIGKSQVMQDVYDLILKAAAADANVIVYGESGTGKELVAHAIHEMSDRKKGSFVPVNCGAIPQNLLESEFFGYKKGAFTGATTDKKGCLDLAHGGTLFLDELGEIDLNFQVKLLRALEDGGYTPLGGQSVQRSNARIVAATNRDLAEAIRQGVMREDFFYRIHIIPIHLPPLRERKEDIPLLIEHFMAKNNPKNPALPLPGDAIETILNHDWPGNVRELQNVLHRYNTLGRLDIGDGIRAEDPMKRAKTKEIEIEGEDFNYQTLMENLERKLILKALEQNQWNRKKAAQRLGIPLRSFFRKISQHGFDKKG